MNTNLNIFSDKVNSITKEKIVKNIDILNDRVNSFNNRVNDIPRVGDYITIGDYYTRVTIVSGNNIQTGGGSNSFYLSMNGYLSYSGSLDSGIKSVDIELIPNVTKKGYIWFFSEDRHEAHNAVNYEIDFRVYRVKDGADISGLYGYKKILDKIENDKLPKVELYNGNGKKYSNSIPLLYIQENNINEVALNRIYMNTDLKFERKRNGYICQPQSYEQYVKLLMTYSFETKYYDGSTYTNTIVLKFNRK